jgi:NADH:ubiquinone oxidoreductase subunit
LRIAGSQGSETTLEAGGNPQRPSSRVGCTRPQASSRSAAIGRIDPALHFERRWVIYNGYAEASMIPPAWHGWMHHIVDVPPTEQKYQPRVWEKPHEPNLTGSPRAYRPAGSIAALGHRPPATGDYKPWVPGKP